MKRASFEQFDMVRLTTTRNVEWMSDLPGNIPDPEGAWSIVALYPSIGTLLLQKDTAMVRVPASDVVKVANFEVEKIYEQVKNSGKKYLKAPECKNRGEPVEQPRRDRQASETGEQGSQGSS